MNITCPQCGFSRDVARDKVPCGNIVAKCPKCQCRFRFSEKDGAGAILPPKSWNSEEPSEAEIRQTASNAYAAEARRFEAEQSVPNPWEEPRQQGWFNAFYQTAWAVMFQPQLFFRYLSPTYGVGRPLGFFLIICVFQTLAERFWGHIIYSWLSGQAGNDPQLGRLLELLAPETGIFIAVLFRTALLVMQLYIFSLLMCLAYRIMVQDRATFRLIFQILAYSSAPWLLCVIPALGTLVGTIWGIACVAIGCKAALDLSWPQTLAGFLPVILLLGPVLLQAVRLLG